MLPQTIPQKLKGVIIVPFKVKNKTYQILLNEKTGELFSDDIFINVKTGDYAKETDIAILKSHYNLRTTEEIAQYIASRNKRTDTGMRTKQAEIEIERIANHIQRKIKYENQYIPLDNLKNLINKFYKQNIEWKKQASNILNELSNDPLYERVDLKLIIRENGEERRERIDGRDYPKRHMELDRMGIEHWISQYGEDSSSEIEIIC